MTRRVRITVQADDGRWRVALTVEQLADRYGLKLRSMSSVITRFRKSPDPEVRKRLTAAEAGRLDGRKTVYWSREFDELMGSRPGTGAHLRRKT